MSPMITYEGLVYMSHGRSLSLPGPHDTGNGAGVGEAHPIQDDPQSVD